MKGIAIKGFEQVLAELAGVEDHLARALGSPVPYIDQLGRFLQGAQGKRLRPALAVLFYKLLGERGDRDGLLQLAAVLELIHLATLVHDDVIDRATTRRNQPALHEHTSNRVAVLEGDYLFVQVFSIINDYPKPTRSLVIGTVQKILEGELRQESLRGVLPGEGDYDEVVHGKTAVLLAAACLIGAQWGDPKLSQARQDAVYEAGLLMGQAFQLVDDLLDVFGDEALGKPRWSDVRGGWLTLPMIRLVEQRPAYRDRLLSGDLSQADRAQIRSELDALGIHHALEAAAGRMLDQAVDQLDWLPDTELRHTLFETIDFIAKRQT